METTELDRAFSTLAEALSLTETEIGEELSLIKQQIDELKDRINSLNEKQQTIGHDREAIADMVKRYGSDG